MINLLCDRAMLAAYSSQQWQIDGKLLKAASREVQGLVEDTGVRTGWLWPSVVMLNGIIVLLLLGWRFWPMSTPEPVHVKAESDNSWYEVAASSRNLPEGFKEIAALWGVKGPQPDCPKPSSLRVAVYVEQARSERASLVRSSASFEAKR